MLNMKQILIFTCFVALVYCVDTLPEGQSLTSGTAQDRLISGFYTFVVQTDGNVVGTHTRTGHVFFSSETENSGTGPYSLTMQSDCNLVLYDSTNTPKWVTGSTGRGSGCRFVLQNEDRNIVIYDNVGAVAWNGEKEKSADIDRLFDNQDITTGVASRREYLISDNRKFMLILADNGSVFGKNLMTSEVFWTGFAGNSGPAPYQLVLETCQLKLKDASNAEQWSTPATAETSGCRLIIQDDRNIVIFSSSDSVVWSTGTALDFSDRIFAPDSLNSLEGREYIVSPNGKYKLIMQDDGNLVAKNTQTNTPFWSNGILSANYPFALKLQDDCNFVEYKSSGVDIWNTQTQGSGSGCRLVIQNDRNIVIYDSNDNVIWETGTCLSASNINVATSIEVAVNYGTTQTFELFTCGGCQTSPDFGGVNFSGLVPSDSNVFWFSIPAQAEAYHVTLSSDSFDGYTEAYFWVFGSDGNLIVEASNEIFPGLNLSLDGDEAILVAFGANCRVKDFELDVVFSEKVKDLRVVLEEFGESFPVTMNQGFDEIISQVQDTEFNLDADLAADGTETENLLNSGFTTVDGGLASISQDLDTSETTILATIDEQCGSNTDSLDAFAASNDAQWEEWERDQFRAYFSNTALVPALYMTPSTQNGLMDEAFSFVSSTYIQKKQFADSQKVGGTCPVGSYCDWFYRLPTGANSSYQTSITTYNTKITQGKWKGAFQQLASAYNALFMGQS